MAGPRLGPKARPRTGSGPTSTTWLRKRIEEGSPSRGSPLTPPGVRITAVSDNVQRGMIVGEVDKSQRVEPPDRHRDLHVRCLIGWLAPPSSAALCEIARNAGGPIATTDLHVPFPRPHRCLQQERIIRARHPQLRLDPRPPRIARDRLRVAHFWDGTEWIVVLDVAPEASSRPQFEADPVDA